MIFIGGMDKGVVLAALYNRARPQGMGFMQYDPTPMTAAKARQLLADRVSAGEPKFIDYLNGRVMKVDISGDSFEEGMYDRDNGPGAAESALAGVLNSPELIEAHKESMLEAAKIALESLDTPTFWAAAGIPSLTLGLADQAEELLPAIKKAIGEEPKCED